jgi:hypothetical protein
VSLNARLVENQNKFDLINLDGSINGLEDALSRLVKVLLVRRVGPFQVGLHHRFQIVGSVTRPMSTHTVIAMFIALSY